MITDPLSEERRRIAKGLERYFRDGPGTFRALLDYIDLGYVEAQLEGWLDFNNAVSYHDQKVSSGERKP